jgi:DNA modification methylase
VIRIYQGDCRERMAQLPDSSVDACVCDPPYELGFMGRSWDKTGIANDPAYIEIACNRIRREAGLFADLEVC